MARIARRQCTLAVPAAMVVALFWTFSVQMMHMSTRLPTEAPPPVSEYYIIGFFNYVIVRIQNFLGSYLVEEIEKGKIKLHAQYFCCWTNKIII